MAPLPISLVGYRVSPEAIERYRVQPDYNNRFLVQDLESQISVPLTLVLVERDEGDDEVTDYYFCCFADHSDRPYEPKDLLAVPVPSAFHQLQQLIPVEGDVQRLFAPRARFFSYHSGKSGGSCPSAGS